MSVADRIGLFPGFGWVFADHSFLVTLLICWAFTPGDLLLGIMLAGLLVCARMLPEQQAWYNSNRWHAIVLVGTIAVAVFMTYGELHDPDGYPREAVLSPTKLYHNFVLYAGYGYVAVTTLVAVLVAARSWWATLAICFGLAWLLIMVLENRYLKTHPEARHEKITHAHIPDSEPIITFQPRVG